MTARQAHMMRMPELIRAINAEEDASDPAKPESRDLALLKADLRWRLENELDTSKAIDGEDGFVYLLSDDDCLMRLELLKASAVDASYAEAVAAYDAPAAPAPQAADEARYNSYDEPGKVMPIDGSRQHLTRASEPQAPPVVADAATDDDGGFIPPVSGGSPDADASLANDLVAQRLWLGEPAPPEADEAIVAAVLRTGGARELGAALAAPLTDEEIDFLAAANAFQDTLDDLGDDAAEGVLAYALDDLDHLGLARVLGQVHRAKLDRAINILTGGADPAEVEAAREHAKGCRNPRCQDCGRGCL